MTEDVDKTIQSLTVELLEKNPNGIVGDLEVKRAIIRVTKSTVEECDRIFRRMLDLGLSLCRDQRLYMDMNHAYYNLKDFGVLREYPIPKAVLDHDSAIKAKEVEEGSMIDKIEAEYGKITGRRKRLTDAEVRLFVREACKTVAGDEWEYYYDRYAGSFVFDNQV